MINLMHKSRRDISESESVAWVNSQTISITKPYLPHLIALCGYSSPLNSKLTNCIYRHSPVKIFSQGETMLI